MKKTTKFILCSALFCAPFLTGCGQAKTDNKVDTEKTETKVDAEQKENKTTEKKDETQETMNNTNAKTKTVKDIDITLESATTLSAGSLWEKGDGLMTAEDGGIYIITKFTIKNNSDKNITVDSMMSFIDSTVDGKDMAPTVLLNPEFDMPADYLDATLKKGQETIGCAVFFAPKDFKEAKVIFAPDAMEEDTVEFTLN